MHIQHHFGVLDIWNTWLLCTWQTNNVTEDTTIKPYGWKMLEIDQYHHVVDGQDYSWPLEARDITFVSGRSASAPQIFITIAVTPQGNWCSTRSKWSGFALLYPNMNVLCRTCTTQRKICTQSNHAYMYCWSLSASYLSAMGNISLRKQHIN